MNIKCETILKKVLIYLKRLLGASHFGMKFISISVRKAKQLRKIMNNRALFTLEKKSVKPLHFHDVNEKKAFDSHSKENHFVALKMLNFSIIFLLREN